MERAAASRGYPPFGTGIASWKSLPPHVPRASTPGIRMDYLILALCLTGRFSRSLGFDFCQTLNGVGVLTTHRGRICVAVIAMTY